MKGERPNGVEVCMPEELRQDTEKLHDMFDMLDVAVQNQLKTAAVISESQGRAEHHRLHLLRMLQALLVVLYLILLE
jgi:hypothetical protein